MLVALSFHKFRHVSLNSDVIGWELKCLNIYWCLNARLCFKKVGRDGPVRHSGRTGIRPQRDRPTEAYLYRPFNGYFCCCNSKLKIYRIKTVNRFTDFFFCPPPTHRFLVFFSRHDHVLGRHGNTSRAQRENRTDGNTNVNSAEMKTSKWWSFKSVNLIYFTFFFLLGRFGSGGFGFQDEVAHQDIYPIRPSVTGAAPIHQRNYGQFSWY